MRIHFLQALRTFGVLCAALAGLLLSPMSRATSGSYVRIPGGVVVTPAAGPAHRVRLLVVTPQIIRVTAFPGADLSLPKSLMVVQGANPALPFKVQRTADGISLSTGRLTAVVSLADGRVAFDDPNGRPITQEWAGGSSFQPVVIDGHHYFAIRQQFTSTADEAFYGLGQHQNGLIDYKGKSVTLAQHNMDVAVPFVVSSGDYGILWDNDSITRFGDPRPWQQLSQNLILRNDQGQPGLTARYYVGGKLVLTRTEQNIDYQYLTWHATYPPSFPKALVALPHVKVVWTGTLEAKRAGLHTFSLYGSDYQQLWIGGRQVIDAWRQNWNPWFRNFSVHMQPGKPLPIRLVWNREGGYIALLHRPPRTAAARNRLSLYSEAGHAIDYYFVRGDDLDQVIAGYRELTGRAVLLPRWAYGYWQSRDHYQTQAQLLGVVQRYRELGIPLDNIVQDWRYWKDDAWGSDRFDRSRYPDPRAMIAEVHALHAHFMISVWPKYYPTTANYKQLAAIGGMFPLEVKLGIKDWVGPGYTSSFYDPFMAAARHLYWNQIERNLGVLGVDAWWLDADEPDMVSNTTIAEREALMSPTPLGPGATQFNAYALEHVCGVDHGNLRSRPDRRVFILSRSGFAGLQRCGAAVWSGDIAPRWSDMKNQIAAGIGFSLSGLPNWTMDIGGYQPETRYLDPDAANLAQWREQYTRWFEFGAFCPIFRSHGQVPYREIFNVAPPGSRIYDILVSYDRLRYRLMPYIYSLAGNTWLHNGTIMRALEMDFPADPNVRSIATEYLFGHAFLVSPVYRYRARNWSVYLPAGTSWYDFYTNRSYAGGQTVTVAAPLSQMPLFVRAGSIVPVGPAIEYTGEKPDAPITLLVYTGRNGTFTLYEDQGTNLGYQKGRYSLIPFSYDRASDTLTIGARKGSFEGMPQRRVFDVRWIRPGSAAGDDFQARPDTSVEYSGTPIQVHCASRDGKRRA